MATALELPQPRDGESHDTDGARPVRIYLDAQTVAQMAHNAVVDADGCVMESDAISAQYLQRWNQLPPSSQRQTLSAVHAMMRLPRASWRAPECIPMQYRDLFLAVAEAAIDFDTEGSD